MSKHIIYGIHITERLKHVPLVQSLLSEYGGHIKTRLGLHEVEKLASPNGLLLLEMYGDESRCQELADKLNAVEGVEVKNMVFTHEDDACG